MQPPNTTGHELTGHHDVPCAGAANATTRSVRFKAKEIRLTRNDVFIPVCQQAHPLAGTEALAMISLNNDVLAP